MNVGVAHPIQMGDDSKAYEIITRLQSDSILEPPAAVIEKLRQLHPHADCYKPDDYEDLMEEAERIAEEVKLCAPLAVQAIKQIVYQGRNLPVEYSQRLGAPLNSRIQATEDAREGPRAFSEKRRPIWKIR